MGRSRYQFCEATFPHFLTGTIVGWLPVFTRAEAVQIVLDSWQFLRCCDRSWSTSTTTLSSGAT